MRKAAISVPWALLPQLPWPVAQGQASRCVRASSHRTRQAPGSGGLRPRWGEGGSRTGQGGRPGLGQVPVGTGATHTLTIHSVRSPWCPTIIPDCNSHPWKLRLLMWSKFNPTDLNCTRNWSQPAMWGLEIQAWAGQRTLYRARQGEHSAVWATRPLYSHSTRKCRAAAGNSRKALFVLKEQQAGFWPQAAIRQRPVTCKGPTAFPAASQPSCGISTFPGPWVGDSKVPAGSLGTPWVSHPPQLLPSFNLSGPL